MPILEEEEEKGKDSDDAICGSLDFSFGFMASSRSEIQEMVADINQDISSFNHI